MVTLIIMDGFGYSEVEHGNAILSAGTPYLDKLKEMYPFTTLACSGEAVGLESGQMGGSEVGHLNIGAGRVVYQDLTKINNQIKSGQFFENEAFLKAVNHVKKTGGKLHLMGLLSDGGIHSVLNHLKALVDLADKNQLKDVCIHAFTDGRDTLKNSGKDFAKQIEQYTKGKAKIASLIGRVYAMDREKRYDRVQKAYNALVLGQAENYFMSVEEAFDESYKNGVFDEFIEPTIIGKPQKIQSGDSVIFFNFRADRARELTQAIAEQNIEQMQLANLHDICFVCMTEYNSEFKNVLVAYKPEVVENNLAKIISTNNFKQFHISETTKYAHVTFFLNGGIEKAYEGEDRVLIESENVKDFALTPNMKAIEITEKTLSALAEEKYDFVVVNLSNADMVGHSGDFEATKKAISIVDKCAYLIAISTLALGGDAIITADHGNADYMLDNNNNVITSHSMAPVPFYLISNKNKNAKLLKNGALCNIAPTILKLLNINIPEDMEKPLF